MLIVFFDSAKSLTRKETTFITNIEHFIAQLPCTLNEHYPKRFIFISLFFRL